MFPLTHIQSCSTWRICMPFGLHTRRPIKREHSDTSRNNYEHHCCSGMQTCTEHMGTTTSNKFPPKPTLTAKNMECLINEENTKLRRHVGQMTSFQYHLLGSGRNTAHDATLPAGGTHIEHNMPYVVVTGLSSASNVLCFRRRETRIFERLTTTCTWGKPPHAFKLSIII
jgi:hypothetical protein